MLTRVRALLRDHRSGLIALLGASCFAVILAVGWHPIVLVLTGFASWTAAVLFQTVARRKKPSLRVHIAPRRNWSALAVGATAGALVLAALNLMDSGPTSAGLAAHVLTTTLVAPLSFWIYARMQMQLGADSGVRYRERQVLEVWPTQLRVRTDSHNYPWSVLAERTDLRRDLRIEGPEGERSITIGRKHGERLTLLTGLSEEEASSHLAALKTELGGTVPPPISAADRALRKPRGVRISHPSDSYRGPSGLLVEVDTAPQKRSPRFGFRRPRPAPTSQRVRIDEQIHLLVDGQEIHLGPSAGASLRVDRDKGIHVRVELADGSEHALLVELSEDQLLLLEPELRKRLRASSA